MVSRESPNALHLVSQKCAKGCLWNSSGAGVLSRQLVGPLPYCMPLSSRRSMVWLCAWRYVLSPPASKTQSPTISHSSPAHRQPDSTASIVCGLFLQKGPFKALGMIPATDEDVRDNPYMSSTRLSYFNWPEHCYLQAWIKLKLHFSISDFQIKLHVVYFLTVPISQKWSNRLSEKGCQTTTRPNGPTDSSPSRHQSRLVLGLMQLLHPSFSVYLPFLAVFFWNWN